MHHWVTAGHLNPAKMLVRRLAEAGEPSAEFVPLSSVFRDQSVAFVPAGMDADAWGELARSLAAEDGATPAAPRAARIADESPSPGGRANAGGEAAPAAGTPPAFGKAEIRDVAEAVRAYFCEGNAWYYTDEAGDQHGPFLGAKMSDWFEAGYLWQRQLQVGHEGWPSFTSLEEVVTTAVAALSGEDEHRDGEGGAAGAGPGSGAGLGAASDQGSAAAASAAVDDDAFEYVDDEGQVQGPFSRSLIEQWVLEEMLPADLRMRPVSGHGGQWSNVAALFGAGEGAPQASAVEAEAPLADHEQIEYLDDDGSPQGPFDAGTVRSWIVDGFFEPLTRARVVGSQHWWAMESKFEF